MKISSPITTTIYTLAVAFALFATVFPVHAELIDENPDLLFDEIKFNIDESKLNGYGLRDRCTEFADLDLYKKNYPLTDENRVTKTAFANILRTIRTMDATRPSWTAEDIMLAQQKYGTEKKCAISIAAYHYYYIRENALRDSLIKFENGIVTDNYRFGCWVNPYLQGHVLAFAPHDTVFGKNMSFVFPKDAFVTNHNGDYGFDPGDGNGPRVIEPGGIMHVTYPTPGVKTIRLIENIRGGGGYSAYNRIYIVNSNNVPSRGENYDSEWESNLIVTDFGEVLLSRYKSNIGMGKQPFIYVEGLDYSESAYKGGYGGLCAEKLFNESTFENEQIRQPMSKDVLSDYDFYYVDFQNGTATVEEKAELLKEAIRAVNEDNSVGPNRTNKGNIIFGSSMGGLVARYCLRDMELSDEAHGTSILICQDTPNLGANVPLGVLYGIHCISDIYDRHVKRFQDLNDKLGELYKLVHSPAAKQLLYNYVDENGDIDNTEHDKLAAKLASMGFPQGDRGNMRCLSISNGCEQISHADSPLLEMTGTITPNQFVDLLGNCLIPILGPVVYWGTRDLKTALLSMVPGSNRIRLWAQINPTGSKSNLCHVKFKLQKKLAWIGPNIYETFYEYKRSAPAGLMHYDLMKGSYYDRRIIKDIDTNPSGSFGFSIDLAKYNVHIDAVDQVLFIPTASALAIGEGKTNLYMEDYTYQFVNGLRPASPKHTPFHDFYISGKSEMHTSFNDNMNKWLKDQLDVHVVGPDVAKTGSTYVLQNAGWNEQIIWNVSDPEIASISNSGVITVKKHGYATVTATVAGKVFPKLIMAELPRYKIQVNPQSGYYAILFLTEKENAKDYELFKNNIRIETAIKKGNATPEWKDCPNGMETFDMVENGENLTVCFRASYVDNQNNRTTSDTYSVTVNTSYPYTIEPNYIKVQSQSILNDIKLKPNPNFKYQGVFPPEFKIYNVISHGGTPFGRLSGVTTLTLTAQNLFPQSLIDNFIINYNQMSMTETFSLVGEKGNIIQTIRVTMTRN